MVRQKSRLICGLLGANESVKCTIAQTAPKYAQISLLFTPIWSGYCKTLTIRVKSMV